MCGEGAQKIFPLFFKETWKIKYSCLQQIGAEGGEIFWAFGASGGGGGGKKGPWGGG